MRDDYFVYVIVFLITICNHSLSQVKFRQERAKVVYSNPKYLTDVTLFTARQRRGSSYLTNSTLTFLCAMGNNITVVIKIAVGKSEPLEVRFKLCDLMKIEWIVSFVKRYSDAKLICPFPPGKYTFYNVEVPPKDFPFPLSTGAYTVTLMAYITETKEKALEMTEYLHAS